MDMFALTWQGAMINPVRTDSRSMRGQIRTAAGACEAFTSMTLELYGPAQRTGRRTRKIRRCNNSASMYQCLFRLALVPDSDEAAEVSLFPHAQACPSPASSSQIQARYCRPEAGRVSSRKDGWSCCGGCRAG